MVDECEEQQSEDSGLKHILSSWNLCPKLHREVCIPRTINQSHLKPPWLCNNTKSWYSKAQRVVRKPRIWLTAMKLKKPKLW